MLINSPEPKRKLVDDYDFVFTGGIVKQIRIDLSLGDTIEFVNGGIKITLASRPSLANPEVILPTEEVTIFSQHLLSIDHRKTVMEELTTEQRYELYQTVKERSKVTH